MEPKYCQKSTYSYELDKERLDWLTDKTNRSRQQTQFLFQLVDGDFDKLQKLEVQIKNCHYNSCPADRESVECVLNLVPKSNFFKL